MAAVYDDIGDVKLLGANVKGTGTSLCLAAISDALLSRLIGNFLELQTESARVRQFSHWIPNTDITLPHFHSSRTTVRSSTADCQKSMTEIQPGLVVRWDMSRKEAGQCVT